MQQKRYQITTFEAVYSRYYFKKAVVFEYAQLLNVKSIERHTC